MKFFTNDAKENSDEPYGRDHGDVVTSDPVAVPQQRAGSPWTDAPATTEAETAHTTDAETHTTDAETSDTASETAPDFTKTETSDTTETDPEVGSPDDELAQQERRDGTDEALPADQPADTGEEPASRRDETDTVTTYHPDGTVETAGDAASVDEPESDPALRRDVAEAPADFTETPVEFTGTPVEDETAKDRAEAQAEADQTVDEARADEAVAESEETPVAVAAVPATPGSTPAAPLDRLFTDGDSYAERFRDIQLKFVDSPKEATADAAALVGEAVDKLTSALQAQKDAVGGDSDDTEQLRVQLRSYRDLLNRLSAL